MSDDDDEWDKQIEADAKEGKLDRIESAALMRAAAPDLYEALARCMPFIDDAMDLHEFMSESAASDECRAAVAAARAALAKARGET